MKFRNQLFILVGAIVTSLTLLPQSSWGAYGDRAGRESQTRAVLEQDRYRPVKVRWIGVIQEDQSSHTTRHEHALRFVRLNDQGGDVDTLEIVDSPELTQLHHESNKKFILEIEGEQTKRFLFWGGNLVVKNFRVISDLGEPVAHQMPAPTAEPRSPERR